ncbi:MAG: hypothetical protein IJM03_12500 [Treponema sp.]|nr:hypothetical protein [Treponema sp.]
MTLSNCASISSMIFYASRATSATLPASSAIF